MRSGTLIRSDRRRSNPFRAAALVILLATSSGTEAAADQGRIEINQARAIAGGVTPGDLPGFPVTIAVQGSYVLTSDLVVSTSGVVGIEVASDNVAIDMAGHVLRGPEVCTGEGLNITCETRRVGGYGIVRGNYIGTILRDGVIRGFERGVEIGALGGCIIEGVRATRNAVIGIGATACVIRDSMADRNAAVGLSSSSSVVERSVAFGNGLIGLAGGSASIHAATTSRANGFRGINAGVCSLVVGSTMSENGDKGIFGAALLVTTTASTLNGEDQIDISAGGAFSQTLLQTDPAIPTSTLVESGVSIGSNLCDGGPCP